MAIPGLIFVLAVVLAPSLAAATAMAVVAMGAVLSVVCDRKPKPQNP